jgi:transposase
MRRQAGHRGRSGLHLAAMQRLCGLIADADVNTAQNILRRGINSTRGITFSRSKTNASDCRYRQR